MEGESSTPKKKCSNQRCTRVVKTRPKLQSTADTVGRRREEYVVFLHSSRPYRGVTSPALLRTRFDETNRSFCVSFVRNLPSTFICIIAFVSALWVCMCLYYVQPLVKTENVFSPSCFPHHSTKNGRIFFSANQTNFIPAPPRSL